ncbi:uncharacterized protein EAF02_001135 [Botrytis sinoallii]|uniref:uncharacterized protein n=1 Tax=Botrytis sinoallii TaxID=1463999 RepID=UPI00190248A5|nr:uncharacterized protein EAF02_001135 [Botrytis sinoallii]KAF7893597.1 hypothetical protein EAF02_001135 [Botrytis sinoallii]
MKFSVITLLVYTVIVQSTILLETVITLADIPISITLNSIVSNSSEFHFNGKFDTSGILVKYIRILIKVIGMAIIKGIQFLTKIAIKPIRNFLKNPDYRKYPVTICYNKRYNIKNPTKIIRKVNTKLSFGFFYINYDYIYITRNNQFYTHTENGFINIRNRFYLIENNTNILLAFLYI